MDDGTELRFDHGAPYFTVSNDEVARVVGGWEARGLVAEWKAMFACFDRETGKFRDFDKVFKLHTQSLPVYSTDDIGNVALRT
jgi:predicted NAD/FAD-dependent oxidoreductase